MSTVVGVLIALVAIWTAAVHLGADGPEPIDATARVIASATDPAGDGAVELDAYEVTGRVVNTHGTPVSGAVVVATTAGDPGLPGPLELSPRAVTDAEGRFVIRGLVPGSYSFVALHGCYPPSTQVDIALRAGEDVFIVLDPDDRILT